MRKIRGHKAWAFEEVVTIFKNVGMFTMCDLPHQRYDRVKGHCRRLKKARLIIKHTDGPNCVHWVRTKLFDRWIIEKDLGITDFGILKWAQQKGR